MPYVEVNKLSFLQREGSPKKSNRSLRVSRPRGAPVVWPDEAASHAALAPAPWFAQQRRPPLFGGGARPPGLVAGRAAAAVAVWRWRCEGAGGGGAADGAEREGGGLEALSVRRQRLGEGGVEGLAGWGGVGRGGEGVAGAVRRVGPGRGALAVSGGCEGRGAWNQERSLSCAKSIPLIPARLSA